MNDTKKDVLTEKVMKLKKRTHTTKDFLTDLFILGVALGLFVGLPIAVIKHDDSKDHKNVVVKVKEKTTNNAAEILLRDIETGAEHGFTEIYDTRHLGQYLYSGDTVSIRASASEYNKRSVLDSKMARLEYSPDSLRARQEREALAKYKSNFAKQR